MPKIKKQSVTRGSSEEPAITIDLRVAGQDKVIKTDNILSALRELDTDITKVKSRATFEVNYKGETYRKILTIIQYKRLLHSDMVKQITAKLFNRALGLPL